jgi:hypothetical protein
MFFNENNTDKKTPVKDTSISDYDQFVDIESSYEFSEQVYQDRDVRQSYKALGSMSIYHENNKVDFSHAVIKPYGITGEESYSSGSGFTISSGLGVSKSSSLNEEYEVDYLIEPLNLNRSFDNKNKLNNIADTIDTHNSTIIHNSIDIDYNASISTFENFSNSNDLNNYKKSERNFINTFSSNKISFKDEYANFNASKKSLDQEQGWASRIKSEQGREQAAFID